MTNNKKNISGSLRRDLCLILFGSFLVLISSLCTLWIQNIFEKESHEAQRDFNRSSLLIAIQSEIETNLIRLHNHFSAYEKMLADKSNIEIRPLTYYNTIYIGNASRIGSISDLGIVREIVAFYGGLAIISDKSHKLSTGTPQQSLINNYLDELANFFGAGFYLQNRLESKIFITNTALPEVMFSPDVKKTMTRIGNFRKKIGIHKTGRLHFHDSNSKNSQ